MQTISTYIYKRQYITYIVDVRKSQQVDTNKLAAW